MLRNYTDADYENLKELYQHSEWFGGQFDDDRDSQQRLAKIIARDPEAIIVAEEGGKIIGSISLFEDGRTAWLFRFVVKDNKESVVKELYERAAAILRERGHEQVMASAPVGEESFRKRYVEALGMIKTEDYTYYWTRI